eukprot:SAG25_NODE_94_length_15935_cov_41.063463_4_plen_169_part_00
MCVPPAAAVVVGTHLALSLTRQLLPSPRSAGLQLPLLPSLLRRHPRRLSLRRTPLRRREAQAAAIGREQGAAWWELCGGCGGHLHTNARLPTAAVFLLPALQGLSERHLPLLECFQHRAVSLRLGLRLGRLPLQPPLGVRLAPALLALGLPALLRLLLRTPPPPANPP